MRAGCSGAERGFRAKDHRKMGVSGAGDARWLRKGGHPGLLEALGLLAIAMVGGWRARTASEQQQERKRGVSGWEKAEERLRVFGGLFGFEPDTSDNGARERRSATTIEPDRGSSAVQGGVGLSEGMRR